MIRVIQAKEPEDFDTKVRQPGLRAIAEMVNELPDKRRVGRPTKIVASKREEIPPSRFPPTWQKALKDLLEAYRRICAYACLYIEPVTGGASVDHMAPKSMTWDRVYEWTNYRLACLLMNSRKGKFDRVLDPFEIGDDWFALDLVGFQVIGGPGATDNIRAQVERTIDELALNDLACRQARTGYAEDYLEGLISLAYLERRAPFVARELRRQGRLCPTDRTAL